MNDVETDIESNVTEQSVVGWQQSSEYKPKTLLGKRLWKLREKIMATGEPLLSWEEVEQEIGRRRGEQVGGENVQYFAG